MAHRRRVKHEKSFTERLSEEAERFRQAASELPEGTARELLLRRALKAETAIKIRAWVSSTSSAPPSDFKLSLSKR